MTAVIAKQARVRMLAYGRRSRRSRFSTRPSRLYARAARSFQTKKKTRQATNASGAASRRRRPYILFTLAPFTTSPSQRARASGVCGTRSYTRRCPSRPSLTTTCVRLTKKTGAPRRSSALGVSTRVSMASSVPRVGWVSTNGCGASMTAPWSVSFTSGRFGASQSTKRSAAGSQKARRAIAIAAA